MSLKTQHRIVSESFTKLAWFVAIPLLLFTTSCSTLNEISGSNITKVATSVAVKQALAPRETDSDFSLDRINDPIIESYVRGISAKLLNYAETKDLSIGVLKTARIQAMSQYLDMQIFLTRGMLNMMTDEAELACIIGHEIGHQDLGHWKQVYKESTGQKLLDKGTGLTANPLVSQFSEVQQNISRAGWEQSKEQAADEYGAVLAAKAGYDPYALCDLFDRLAQKVGINVFYHMGAVAATHKALDVRANHLREYLRAKGYLPAKGFRGKEQFQTAMADLENIHTGEGGKSGKNLSVLMADQKKDVTDLKKIYDELQQDDQSGTKLPSKRFLEIMQRYSQYLQKYHIARSQLQKVSGLNETAFNSATNLRNPSHFMSETIYQDEPFFDPTSPNGLGPAGQLLINGLDLIAKVGFSIATPEVMIPIMAYEAISGQGIFTGDQLSTGDRILSGLGAMVGAGGKAIEVGTELAEMAQVSEAGQTSAEIAQGSENVIKSAQEIFDETQDLNVRTAEETNNELKDVYKYKNPPVMPDTNVCEGALKDDKVFYRVYTSGEIQSLKVLG